MQRDRFFAIVDEVDSVLIDEARTPLIIAGDASQTVERYHEADTTAKKLVLCFADADSAEFILLVTSRRALMYALGVILHCRTKRTKQPDKAQKTGCTERAQHQLPDCVSLWSQLS